MGDSRVGGPQGSQLRDDLSPLVSQERVLLRHHRDLAVHVNVPVKSVGELATPRNQAFARQGVDSARLNGQQHFLLVFHLVSDDNMLAEAGVHP